MALLLHLLGETKGPTPLAIETVSGDPVQPFSPACPVFRGAACPGLVSGNLFCEFAKIKEELIADLSNTQLENWKGSYMHNSVTMLGFKIEEDPTDAVVTGFSGLLAYMDLWRRFDMPGRVDETVHICGSQGWLDRQIVETLMLVNVAGGDCVTDVDRLEADAGLCRVFSRSQYSGMSRAESKAAQKRFRSGKSRTFPAATQISAFLEACHNEEEEKERVAGRAFIPQPNEHLASLYALNTHLIDRAQRLRASEVATLDCDATLVERNAGGTQREDGPVVLQGLCRVPAV